MDLAGYLRRWTGAGRFRRILAQASDRKLIHPSGKQKGRSTDLPFLLI
jgi:hypothetical protein